MINNFEDTSSSEWDGLDALLAAKPIDLNAVRDSEFFGGGGAQRMSFYMSPPKEANPRASNKFDRPYTSAFGSNKENRVNNAFVATEPKEPSKPLLAAKYTKPKAVLEPVNEEAPLPASYTTPSYPTPSSSSSSASSYSIPSSFSSIEKPLPPKTPLSASSDKFSALSSSTERMSAASTPSVDRTLSSMRTPYSSSSSSALTASLERPPSYPSKEDKPPAYPSTKELPPAYPEPQTPSSLSSSLPKASNLVKPRSKSSTLSTYPVPTSTSSSSLTSSFSSTPAATPLSTPISTPLPTPPTPSTTSAPIKSTSGIPSPSISRIPSFSKSSTVVNELSTPARPSSASSSSSATVTRESNIDEMLRRISRLEEENKQLRETVEQSNSEKKALSKKVASLEDELHNFMREVQIALVSR